MSKMEDLIDDVEETLGRKIPQLYEMEGEEVPIELHNLITVLMDDFGISFNNQQENEHS
jgi:hypothetical protein